MSTDVAIFGELVSTRWFGRQGGRVDVSGMVMTGKVRDNSLLSTSREAGTPSGASSRQVFGEDRSVSYAERSWTVLLASRASVVGTR